jgi:hypothetical protein
VSHFTQFFGDSSIAAPVTNQLDSPDTVGFHGFPFLVIAHCIASVSRYPPYVLLASHGLSTATTRLLPTCLSAHMSENTRVVVARL